MFKPKQNSNFATNIQYESDNYDGKNKTSKRVMRSNNGSKDSLANNSKKSPQLKTRKENIKIEEDHY